MQRTILAPTPPLGYNINELVSETSTSASRQPSSNSLIIEGGSMRVVPAAQSTATTPRPITGRRVSTSSQSLRNNNNQVASSSHFSLDNRLSSMMEAMESSNQKLFRRSYQEVLEDYDVMKARLAKAHEENDAASVQLFDDLCNKLLAELQGTSL